MSFKTIIDNATGVVTQDGGQVTLPAPTEQGQTLVANSSGAYVASTVNPTFKNRIINGDMRVAQRGTAAVTTSTGFPVDRFSCRHSVTGGAFSAVQSVTAPVAFTNSMQWTTTTAASAGAAESGALQQRVEGVNITDLAWGSASAKTITLSFWVQSSSPGTYCVSLRNSALDRSYVAEYVISTANTWEKKSLTIVGPSSGTWITTTGVGIYLNFDLGSGSGFNTTAGSWQNGDFTRTANQFNFSNTLNAVFRLTGVQLEAGSVATEFELRPQQVELALCQRYYQHYPSQTNPYACFGTGVATSTGAAKVFFKYATAMRATPTLSFSLPVSNFMFSDAGFFRQFTGFGASYYGDNTILFDITASSLTQGRAMTMFGNNTTNAFLALSAEL